MYLLIIFHILIRIHLCKVESIQPLLYRDLESGLFQSRHLRLIKNLVMSVIVNKVGKVEYKQILAFSPFFEGKRGIC